MYIVANHESELAFTKWSTVTRSELSNEVAAIHLYRFLLVCFCGLSPGLASKLYFTR